jgi:hypothetical protein
MIRDIVLVLVLIICTIILVPGVTRLARSFWDWALGKPPADKDAEKPGRNDPPAV